MEVDLEKLSHVVLGDSAEPPTPSAGVVRSLTTPITRRRPVSILSLSPTPSFPNLLSSLTERPQPLSPTVAKAPASRYIRPGRCVTDSCLGSSIDSLLVSPPSSLPARAPVPAPLPALAPATPPLLPTTTKVESRELAGSLEAPPVLENAAAISAKPTEVLNSDESLSQFTDSTSLKGFGSVFDAEKLTTTADTTTVETTTTEVSTTTSASTAQSNLEGQEEEIVVKNTPLVTTLPETTLEVGTTTSASKAQSTLEDREERIGGRSSLPLGTILPKTTPEANTTVPSRTAATKASTPLVTTLPESPPTTPPQIRVKTSTIGTSKLAELEATEPPTEGDTFRDFRESPSSKLTPPVTPSSPVTKAAGLGRFSSFSNLVQVVTSARPSEMGFTGDGRVKAPSVQHGLFGGWLQAKGGPARALVDGFSTKRDVGSQLPSPGRSQAVPNAGKTVSGKENPVRGVATMEGCSRPTTQQPPSVGSAFVSPAKAMLSPLKPIPEPPHPALVDEFQGLNFSTLINSFLNPGSQAKGLMTEQSEWPSTEAQLEELATMAQDLLERMYTAYTKRTMALGEVLADQSVLREEVEERKVKALHLQAQLDRVSQDAIKSKAEQDEVICDLVHELANEKLKMDEERGQQEEEMERWRSRQEETIRAELRMEMLTAQEPNVGGAEASEECAGDADTLSKNKRISSGGESSDSGFDESDSDSLYSIVKRESAMHQANVVPIKPSLVSISSMSTAMPMPTRSGGNTDESEKRVNTATPPVLSSTPISVALCENCSRLPFTRRPPSPTPSTLDIPSPSTAPSNVNSQHTPTALSKGSESTQRPSTLSSATSTSSRWGLGVLRGGSSAQTQQELDRLRVENKSLRQRVGDLEKSVDEVLGVVGGWRS